MLPECLSIDHGNHWAASEPGKCNRGATAIAPHEILPESRRRLWLKPDAVPPDFVLFGGTALAIQIGHRIWEDLDFFSSAGFDPDWLRARLPFFRELDPADPDAWVQRKRDTLEAFVDRGGPVKLAFFDGLKYFRAN